MLRRFARHSSLMPFVFYAEDDGTNAGGSGDDPKDGATNGDEAGKSSETTSGAITFASQTDLQAYIDNSLKDRLARKDREREKAEETARRKAEEDAAAKNGEWQKLAEQHAKRLAELEPLPDQIEAHKAENDRLRAALKAQVDELRKDIPAPIIALLDRMDLIEQMTWIAANREQVVGANGKALIKASPTGAGALSRDELIHQEIEAQRARARR